MKLSLEQIKDIAVGIAYASENDGKISLHRFTKDQEELYRTVRGDFYKKAFASAGVRLEFITDSSSLSMSVSVGYGSSRKYFCHSIFVNGESYASLNARSNTGVFSGKWSLPEGENKVAIYFPWSVSSDILSLELDDGATLVPVKKAHTMISFGDSITHGYDASSPELSYASVIADALDADSRNKGIGAEIFRPELAALHDGISPDYITVAYGTNDWSALDQEAFEANCRAFYTALSENYPAAKIFAVTPIYRKDWLKVSHSRKFYAISEFIHKLSTELPNVTAIEGIGFIPQDLSCFSPDGVHPNDKGFKYYGEALAEEIKKYL